MYKLNRKRLAAVQLSLFAIVNNSLYGFSVNALKTSPALKPALAARDCGGTATK